MLNVSIIFHISVFFKKKYYYRSTITCRTCFHGNTFFQSIIYLQLEFSYRTFYHGNELFVVVEDLAVLELSALSYRRANSTMHSSHCGTQIFRQISHSTESTLSLKCLNEEKNSLKLFLLLTGLKLVKIKTIHAYLKAVIFVSILPK